MIKQGLEARLRVDIRCQMYKREAIFVNYLGDVKVGAGEDAGQTRKVIIVNVANDFALIMLLIEHIFKTCPVRLGQEIRLWSVNLVALSTHRLGLEIALLAGHD